MQMTLQTRSNEMPSKHKGHPTIAFRPDNSWQYALIDRRAAMSGLYKKDFIIRCCVYSRICVVGKKENIAIIVRAVRDMQLTMMEIAEDLKQGDFKLTDEAFAEMKDEFLALAVTLVEILNGAAYLFDQIPNDDYQEWKLKLQPEQFKAKWMKPFTEAEIDSIIS